MLIRSLVVLLVVLNLGVAAWWVLHDTPAETPVLQPAGVPRLQLREELAARRDAATNLPAPVRAPATRRPAQATACTGEDAGAAGWRVYLPPLASADAAEQAADRIADAGFTDYLVIRDGSEANSVALGRYGTREAAQRRLAGLQAAGFAARCARIEAESQD